MSEQEHLDKIAAKCRLLLANDFRPDTGLTDGLPSVTHALASSTLAAIEELPDMNAVSADILSFNIRKAWVEELL